MEKNKKILSYTIIIVSIIIFIGYLFNCEYIGEFEFNYLCNPENGKRLSIFGMIIYYGLVDFCIYVVYFSILFLISLLQWYFLHRDEEMILKRGYTQKYSDELTDVFERVIPILVIVEIIIVNILIMFSIISI